MPATFEALAIVLLAVVPGYLARSAWARGKTFSQPPTDLKVVVQSVAASLVVQLLLAWFTIPVLLPVGGDLANHPWRVAAWAVVAGLLAPVLGGYVLGKLTDQLQPGGRLESLPAWIRRDLGPTPPTIWDAVNLSGEVPDPCLLVIEFTDGTRVAGSFGQGSRVITSPDQHGVFLGREWSVGDDGLPTEPVPSTGGILVPDLAAVRSIRVLVAPEPV
jgi:hypothetical protein